MLTISRKRFLRRALKVDRSRWDECSQDELLELFKILGSSWYSIESRKNISEFLDEPNTTPNFPIKNYKKFTGPSERLRGMSFGQWAFLELKMFNLNQERSPKNIRSFLACLYIPKNKFNSDLLPELEKQFNNVSPEFINASIRSWDAIRKWCYGLYPFVFPVSNSQSTAKPKAPEYVKIMRKMAGSVSDVEVEKIFNSNAHHILSALNDELTPRKK